MKIINKKIRFLVAGILMGAATFYGSVVHAAKCEYLVNDDWGSGFTATIRITNNTSTTLNTWQVSWNYTDGTRRTDGWNATVSGSNPYSALPLSWNATINPGSVAEFGVKGTNGGTKASVPAVTGSVCNAATNSAPAASSKASSSAAVASSKPDSSKPDSSKPSSSKPSSSKPDSSKPNSSKPNSSKPNSSTPSSSKPSSSIASSSASSEVATCDGYATRYWDCCKAHCSWKPNVPASLNPVNSCSTNNSPVSDVNLKSSCDGGTSHMCWGLTPFAVSDKLSYGYAATSNGDVCGRCYLLQFKGTSYNSPGDPGSAALAGKSMIVQATNIGGDVGNGQFDILVPGGGVGAFNACSAQWGVSNAELGAQYGGLVAACKQELGYNATLAQYKNCLSNRCTSVFGSRGLTDLQKGCQWYADWFEAADNPALKFKEVVCPAELTSRSGIDRGPLNDIKNTCQ
jgi:hypothetical protein